MTFQQQQQAVQIPPTSCHQKSSGYISSLSLLFPMRNDSKTTRYGWNMEQTNLFSVIFKSKCINTTHLLPLHFLFRDYSALVACVGALAGN